MKLPSHEATTAQLGALNPAIVSESLPGSQVLVGRDFSGALFCHDPFELYRLGALTNPNIAVLGQIGRGKSAFVKSYCFRQAAFGRRVVILDPKGEYGPLALALGTHSIELAPGGVHRLNPLDPDGRSREDVSRRQDSLVSALSLAAVTLERPLRPIERVCLEVALDMARRSAAATLPMLVEHLLEPSSEQASALGLSKEELRSEGRDVAFELRRYVSGELAGMFDGPTSASINLEADAVVFDLSSVYRSAALGAVIACVQASLEVALRASARPCLLVIDEAWAVLANEGSARMLQSSFKLARANGMANLLVVHRVSDLLASGSSGSVPERLASGLLSDCESIVCFAQSEHELASCQEALGLSDAERHLLPTLRRGWAIWRVAGSHNLVEHRLSSEERTIVDTDGAFFGERARISSAQSE